MKYIGSRVEINYVRDGVWGGGVSRYRPVPVKRLRRGDALDAHTTKTDQGKKSWAPIPSIFKIGQLITSRILATIRRYVQYSVDKVGAG